MKRTPRSGCAGAVRAEGSRACILMQRRGRDMSIRQRGSALLRAVALTAGGMFVLAACAASGGALNARSSEVADAPTETSATTPPGNTAMSPTWDDDRFVAPDSNESQPTDLDNFPTRIPETINPDTGEIQENSLMKWDEWPRNAHLEAALFKAEPSVSLRKKFGEAAQVAAYDAALAVAITQVGMPGLYGLRDGDEGDYYAPIRPYLTDALWDSLEQHISEGVKGQSFYIGSFAPQTDRDGIWTTIDGVPYVSTGKSSITFYGIPKFSMQGDLLSVAFDITVTGHARPADIQYDALYTAIMRLQGNEWKLNGWNNLVTSEIRILDDHTSIGQ